jgi:WS/DGAT/MGAT family acyltransferase
LIDRAREELGLAALPARMLRSPGRVLGQARRAAGALADAIRPASPSPLNDPISPMRHMAFCGRPLEDLLRIKECFEVPLNDVLLAVSAGGVRRFLHRRGDSSIRLKTMVPISVRSEAETGELGNRLSFMFIDLPCDEPDPVRRLRDVHLQTSVRKEQGEPQGASTVLSSLRYAPRALQRVLSRAAATRRSFNLVVSNIPGPREPLYLLGCELSEAYPVVPLADGHDLSIGMTTVADRACFGLYADRQSLPDVDLLARDLDLAVDELLERSVGEELTETAGAMP